MSVIPHQDITSRKLCIVLCVTLAFAVCLRHTPLCPIPLAAISLLSLLVFLASVRASVSVCIPLACFVATYGILLAIHPEPATWLRSQRFIAFTIGMCCFSPLFQSSRLVQAQHIIAKATYVVLSVLVFISFLIWVICLLRWGENGIWSHGFHNYGFCGAFRMGMILSPVAAVVTIVSAAMALSLVGAQQLKEKAYVSATYGLMVVIGILMCAVGGSRISFLGLAISLLALLTIRRKSLAVILKKRTAATVLTCGVLAIIALLPLASNVIRHKNAIGESHGTILYSRQELWNNRIEEFKTSPLTGIGYANELSSDSESEDSLREIEPGSSWLSLLSYGGIIGASSFLWFLLLLGKRLIHSRNNHRFPLLFSLLLFLLVNASTEGWLMFAGSIMFPVFWLTVSAIWKAGATSFPTQPIAKNG